MKASQMKIMGWSWRAVLLTRNLRAHAPPLAQRPAAGTSCWQLLAPREARTAKESFRGSGHQVMYEFASAECGQLQAWWASRSGILARGRVPAPCCRRQAAVQCEP